jgi:hypothetical protein
VERVKNSILGDWALSYHPFFCLLTGGKIFDKIVSQCENNQSDPFGQGIYFFTSKNMAENKEVLEKSAKNFAVGMAAYSSASVLGPLIIFGVIGYFLDQHFHGHNLILLICIFIAFIITNILIFRKAFAVMAELKNFHGNGKNGYDEDDNNEDK